MTLRKVTLFDHDGPTLRAVDEEGQAKPSVLGVHWVDPDTFETIRARGGNRTDPYGKIIETIEPTFSRSPFYAGGFFSRRYARKR